MVTKAVSQSSSLVHSETQRQRGEIHPKRYISPPLYHSRFLFLSQLLYIGEKGSCFGFLLILLVFPSY
jgi:hypothetical protein